MIYAGDSVRWRWSHSHNVVEAHPSDGMTPLVGGFRSGPVAWGGGGSRTQQKWVHCFATPGEYHVVSEGNPLAFGDAASPETAATQTASTGAETDDDSRDTGDPPNATTDTPSSSSTTTTTTRTAMAMTIKVVARPAGAGALCANLWRPVASIAVVVAALSLAGYGSSVVARSVVEGALSDSDSDSDAVSADAGSGDGSSSQADGARARRPTLGAADR